MSQYKAEEGRVAILVTKTYERITIELPKGWETSCKVETGGWPPTMVHKGTVFVYGGAQDGAPVYVEEER